MAGRMVGALVLLTAVACAPVAQQRAPEREADELASFEVMTLNIWHNQEDWPGRLGAIEAGVRAAAPDIICLQEVLEEPGLPNQARTLAERLGYEVHFASWDSVGSPKRYGNAILSRTPILEQDHRLLDPADDYRVVLHARIEPWGDSAEADPLEVYCTHLHHTAEGADTRRTQVLDALEFIDLTRGDGPVVFAGDFNAPTDAPELQAVRDRFGDAYLAVHGDTAADVTTLNTAKGHRSARIDHVFYRSGLEVDLVPRSAEVVLDEPTSAGIWPSDHFGVLVRFAIEQEPPSQLRGAPRRY